MAAPTKENLLIIGATGYIGTYITEQILLAKESFGRIAIFTSPNTAEKKPEVLDKLRAQGVEVIIGDVKNSQDLLKAFEGLRNPESTLDRALADLFEGITTVISAVGRPVIADQIPWLPLLIQASSVKRFFPSEYGTDIEYDSSSANEIPHQQKLKVRAALRKLEAEGKLEGLEYTYVVTGPFAYGYLSNKGITLGGFDVQGKRAVVLEDGKGKVSLTTDTEYVTLSPLFV